MIIFVFKEENVFFKKCYVVFNYDGILVELKGFEIKWCGEFKFIKVF